MSKPRLNPRPPRYWNGASLLVLRMSCPWQARLRSASAATAPRWPSQPGAVPGVLGSPAGRDPERGIEYVAQVGGSMMWMRCRALRFRPMAHLSAEFASVTTRVRRPDTIAELGMIAWRTVDLRSFSHGMKPERRPANHSRARRYELSSEAISASLVTFRPSVFNRASLQRPSRGQRRYGSSGLGGPREYETLQNPIG